MKILKEKTVSFLSRSVELDNYEIFTILQFDWDFYNSFYALSGRNKFDRESLLDSLIGIFLEESLDTMYRPRAAASPQLITIDKREVFRIATSNFVTQQILKRVNHKAHLSSCTLAIMFHHKFRHSEDSYILIYYRHKI